MVDVSVVVVAYNAGDWLQRSLAAARQTATRVTTELVVIDNASVDFGVEDVRRWAGPDAVVERQEQNLGFGRACNRAVELSSGEYVLLLNPDAIISDGAIDALVDLHRSKDQVGIVGGRVTAPDGELDRGSCWGFQTTWSLLCFALGLSTLFSRSATLNPEGLGSWDRDSTRQVDVVTGCLLLIDRALWDRLDGFDPDFFMYGEDADLCRRALDAGGQSWITPQAHAVHALGASSGTTLRKQQLLFRGKATLVRKGARHGLERAVQLAFLRAGVALRAVGERLTRSDRAAWRGLWASRVEWVSGWPSHEPDLGQREAA